MHRSFYVRRLYFFWPFFVVVAVGDGRYNLMFARFVGARLLQDPYGNYVVQYVLGVCSREEADVLVNVPIGKVTPPRPQMNLFCK